MSPRGTLSWITDDVKLGWLLVDAAIFGALPVAGVAVFRLRRRREDRRLVAWWASVSKDPNDTS